jgi:uncharacterized cofD-like protein
MSSTQPKSDLHVVTIGGGTGSFTLLSVFKEYFNNLSAIVTMSDNGSSTGKLRDELGVLPPGDARQCLVALSESPKVRDLFNYRFDEGSLSGHSFGNLFLAALEKLTGSFAEAVETASEVLNVRGQVIPATLDNVQLRMAWPEHQLVLDGEEVIDVDDSLPYDPRQAVLSLKPAAQANPAALAAIANADIVVIAPGDLYTSLGAVLVADGFREALESTKAKVVYICNLVTKKGHTDGFDVAAHTAEIERFVGAPIVDVVFYDDTQPPDDLLERYAKKGEFWVQANTESLQDQHYKAIGGNFVAPAPEGQAAQGDLIAAHRTYIRHDAVAVAKSLLTL